MATKECLHTCGPCSLCTKSSEKYKHYQDLTLEEKGVIFQYKRTHSDLSCICYPCIKQIARFIQNPNLKACPRWVQKQPNKAGVCNITSCHEQIHSNTRLATPSEIEQLLAVKMEAFTVLESTSISVGLCRDHYNALYRELHPKEPCGSCGALPGRGESAFTRKCSDPEVISAHLNRISNEHKMLTAETRLCLPCYKHCNNIIHNIKKYPQPVINIMVHDIINSLDTKIHKYLIIPPETRSKQDYFELASTRCAKILADCLANNEAVLLSTVYDDFVHDVESNGISRDSIPGQRWLLSRLNLTFNGLLEVQCKHKRHGSILFLKDCDLVAAVSHALGKQAAAIKQKSTHEIHPSPPQAATCTLDERLVQVSSSYINNRLHKQAKDLVSHYKNNPHEYSTLNLE